MSTEYHIRLDRAACEGVFACLVRDERFREAADGLATVASAGTVDGDEDEELVAAFVDDRLAEARQAARACPVDAITVTEAGDE
jgi:ferredoxin